MITYSRTGSTAACPSNSEDLTSFGHVFNRIVHLRDTPSVPHVFSARWDPENAERQYLEGAFGLVVVDDFLSTEALESVRAFCLEFNSVVD